MQAPARFTPSLTGDEDFPSDGPKLIEMVERLWRTPAGGRIVLDEWQRWLLRHILELYPDDWPEEHLRGKLRYRQVLVSVARQNGKSEIAAWLGLYFLFQHTRAPQVLGVASNFDQARIIYDRVLGVVTSQPRMSRLVKPTQSKGIRFRDGRGSYTIKPAKMEAVQGFTATGIFCDELHIMPRALYDALVNGQRAQKDSLLVGITTAGDDTSELLLSLYAKAEEAVEDPGSRFGAFVWEAPVGARLDDLDAIRAANPSIEAGRLDIGTVVSDTRDEPEHTRRRFLLNQFVKNMNAWCDPNHWRLCGGGRFAPSRDAWVSVDVAPSMAWASIAVARRDEATGKVRTQLIATVKEPTVERLQALCTGLRVRPAGFVIDTYRLRDLSDHLEQRGHKVVRADSGTAHRASAIAYSLIVKHRVSHGRDEAVKRQFQNGVAKSKGETWRIVRASPKADIDALMATVLAIYAADTAPVYAPMIA